MEGGCGNLIPKIGKNRNRNYEKKYSKYGKKKKRRGRERKTKKYIDERSIAEKINT